MLLYHQNVCRKLYNLSNMCKQNCGGQVSDIDLCRVNVNKSFENGNKIKNTNTLHDPKCLLGGVLAKPLLSDFAHKNKEAANSKQNFRFDVTLPSAAILHVDCTRQREDLGNKKTLGGICEWAALTRPLTSTRNGPLRCTMASFYYNYQNSFRFPFQIQIL